MTVGKRILRLKKLERAIFECGGACENYADVADFILGLEFIDACRNPWHAS